MSWNPSVRAIPVVAPSKPLPQNLTVVPREMESAAAAAVAMALVNRSIRNNRRPVRRTNGVASSWVVNGRMDMINRWSG
ncbi:MAG TPA: hypothetical protein ENN67_01195 [Firmicutes bacterium]|nr:hypothetical protein [Bacillota bacterium]